MITELFYIDGYENVVKIQQFIRENMKSARFIHNPYETTKDNYCINVSYEIEDMNKLTSFVTSLNPEDDNTDTPKIGILTRIKNYITKLIK